MKKILFMPFMAVLLFCTSVSAQNKPDYNLQLIMWENIPNWVTNLPYDKNTYADEVIKRVIQSSPLDNVDKESFDVYRKNNKGATILAGKNCFISVSDIDSIDDRKKRDKVILFLHDKKNDTWKKGTVDDSSRIHWIPYSKI